MGQALYRQYRPKKLSDVAGQEHVTRALSQALKTGQISHAYLFTGPRGVGKTSIARILAHEVNGLKYSDDALHIDIIEIDAASNRRIDEIRELRDKVYVAPTQAKYKVYIIDEVHMLTKEAFNALLKTLEEPPAHVIFILATTDAHKLPETIISRTQRYSFKPLSVSDSVKQLEKIAKAEKIKFDESALNLIAEHSDGSLRDSLSLLDQAKSYSDKVDEKAINQLLGLPPLKALDDLNQAVFSGQPASQIVSQLTKLYDQGYQAPVLAKQLGELIRSQVVNGQRDSRQALDILGELIEVPASHEPNRYLEVTLLKHRTPGNHQAEVSVTAEPIEPVMEVVKEAKAPAKLKASAKLEFNDQLWLEILSAVKQKHNTLYGMVRMAEPRFEPGGVLVLSFGFDFHKKTLSEASNKKLLADIVEQLTGQAVTLEYSLDKSAKPIAAGSETPAANNDDLSAITDIFNGAELLES